GRTVDGDRMIGEHVGERADVILVAVGEEDRPKPVAEAAQVRDVRDGDVDPGHLLVREHHAAVDRDRGVPVLEDEEVEPDLAEPAERDHPKRRAHTAATADPPGLFTPPSSSVSMKLRTRAKSSSRDTPSTAIGGPTTTSISPEAGCQDPRGRISRLPRTAIGTIGKLVSIAIMKPPFLNGSRGWCAAERVPS